MVPSGSENKENDKRCGWLSSNGLSQNVLPHEPPEKKSYHPRLHHESRQNAFGIVSDCC